MFIPLSIAPKQGLLQSAVKYCPRVQIWLVKSPYVHALSHEDAVTSTTKWCSLYEGMIFFHYKVIKATSLPLIVPKI